MKHSYKMLGLLFFSNSLLIAQEQGGIASPSETTQLIVSDSITQEQSNMASSSEVSQPLMSDLIAQEQPNMSSPSEMSQPLISEPKWRAANLAIWGDFLYWKATVSNLPYAITATEEDSIVSFANNESLREVRFGYDPGFRVGIAAQFDTGWDLRAEYTEFNTTANASKSATAPKLIFPLWDLALPAMISDISAHQTSQFDQATLDFVKHFCLGSHFSLDPFFGATGAILHQRLKLSADQLFDPPSTGTLKVRIKNYFAGGGLNMGLQANYNPLRWLSFYGKGSYSLLYGKFKLSTHSKDVIGPSPLLSLVHTQSSDEFALVNAFDLMAGLKLIWSFGRCQLMAHLDYEFVFWPGQVRVPRIRSDLSSKTPTTLLDNAQGDVGFHGLTTGLMFSF